MEHADRHSYAVGYFESWNLESLLAVADAAEAARSPVLLGFSGIYLPHPDRIRREPLGDYAALGLEVCRRLSVPAALVFNESPHMAQVFEAIRLGFGLVMFTDETLTADDQIAGVTRVASAAHTAGIAAEGELMALPGVGGDLPGRNPAGAFPDNRLTDLAAARDFVDRTGVDAFAVNIGQMHFHGRREVRLDLERLCALRDVLSVPLVLHGASSVRREDLVQAIRLGIRKINVGSALKQSYFGALRDACAVVGEPFNPYEVIGSGLAADVLTAGRVALQRTVEDLMHLFGSAG
jgi:fructose/tagatose bisphosphate aldolase